MSKLVEKYNITGGNIISPSDYETTGTNRELKTYENGEISTQVISKNKNSYTSYFYIAEIDSSNDFIILESDLKSKNIMHSELYWEAARIAVHFFDANKSKIKGNRHTARYIYKNHDWFKVNHTFKIPVDAVYVKTGLEFLNTSGSVSFKNTKLTYANESILHNLARITLLFSWLITIFFFINALMKKNTPKMKHTLSLLLFLIILGIILPQDIKSYLTNSIIAENKQYVIFSINSNMIKLEMSFMKTIHIIAFSILSFTSLITFSKNFRQIYIILNLISFTIFTEIIQLLIPGRTPQISDIIIDNFGILIGFVTYTIYKITFIRNDVY